MKIPFIKRNKQEEVPVLTTPFICKSLGDDGTLSVILALLAILAAFFLHHRVYRQTKKMSNAQKREECHKSIAWTTRNRGLLDPTLPVKGRGILYWIETNFVDPFVPASLEHFVHHVFFFWFMFTITMGSTRYYKKIWAVENIGQHAIFNFMSYLFFGCKGKDMMATEYTTEIPENALHIHPKVRNSPEEIDSYILLHFSAATLWLFCGFYQIYMAKGGFSKNVLQQRKFHRYFGMFSLVSLFFHVFFASRIALRNPVNQEPLIKYTGYLGMCLEVTLSAIFGVKYAIAYHYEEDLDKKEDLKRQHRYRMVACWLQATFGSGAIRVCAWFLWLIAHFLPLDWQARVDRAACQNQALERGQQLGSAESCWVPVFCNLALANLLVVWLLWIVFHLIDFTKRDRKAFKSKFVASLFVALLIAVTVPVGKYWPQTEWYVRGILWPLSLLSRMKSLWDLIYNYKLDEYNPANSYRRGNEGFFGRMTMLTNSIRFGHAHDD